MELLDYVMVGLVLVVLVGGAYAVFGGNGLLVSQESGETTIELADIAEAEPLPVLREAPEITGIVDWINTDPVTKESLKGKVVLIDFWTYSCINCIRTLPYLTSWYEKYKDSGFILLGVHTPEFEFEKEIDNVQWAVDKWGIEYPVVLDNDYGTWQAYGNRYWPRKYLIDIDGFIVYDHIG